MWGMNYTEIKEVCKTYSKGFDEVEKLIMDWGRDNKDLKKPLQEITALDTNARYPAGYGNMSAGNYLLSLVLTDPKAIKKLHAKHEASMTSNAKKVLAFWKESPAFWCFFEIKEKLEGDLLTIIDQLTGMEHLLYSPGVAGMQKSGESRGKHYITLMLPNGECLQTAGIIRYNSLSRSDLNFYLTLFDPDGSLESIINTHYNKFFMLDEISTLPLVMHRGNQVLYTWQEFTLKDFDIALLGGEWTITEKGSQISYSLAKPDEYMMQVPHGDLLESDFPAMSFILYRDTSTGSMAINTTALTSYTIIASLLTRAYPDIVLSKEPKVAISMALNSLLDRMDLDLRWSKFKTIMDIAKEPKNKGPESEEMAQINKLLQEYMLAQNTGKPFDARAYSKKSGMALENVKGIVESLENTFAKTMPDYEVEPEDTKYELSGWPIPPPATRQLFSDSIVGSDLFDFDEGPNTLAAFDALTGGLYKKEIFAVGLQEFVEELFFDYFQDYGFVCTLENAFFWILFYKGREWLPVRSYAIEMLKLFPHPIGQVYPDAEEFIGDFSQFTKRILCTRGICSLSARPKAAEVKKGTYAIKGSDAFYSLVERVNA